MTTTRHKAVQIEMLAESECTTEECAHEDECPTFLTSVCLYCNAEQQGTEDMSLWEGSAARCPLYGTGVPVNPERAPWTDATPSEVRAIVEAHKSSYPSRDAIDAARYRERMGDLESADDEALAHTPGSSGPS